MSVESTEESCRHFLESDASAEAKAYYCLSTGQQMERERNYEAALACYSLAFGLTPGTDDVWYFLHNNHGYCLNHFEKHAEAEAYCCQAIEINPARHNAYKNLGVSLQGQGEYIAAAHSYLRAAETAPEDPGKLQHLSALLREHPEIGGEIPDIPLELAIDPGEHPAGLKRLTLEQKKALLLALLDRCKRSAASNDDAGPNEEGQ